MYSGCAVAVCSQIGLGYFWFLNLCNISVDVIFCRIVGSWYIIFALTIHPYFAFWDMGRHLRQQRRIFINAAGIFLLEFHCELSFIEFFWGAVKKCLCDNCNYTFDTLKENLLKALASVDVKTIRKWEHCTMWWLDSYSSGKGTKEAQLHVKQFSSHVYTSHHCIPAHVATLMDN